MFQDGFDRVFVRCAQQMGLVDEGAVKKVEQRVAQKDFRPPWLILVDTAKLSFDQIDQIKSEVAKFQEDCPRCQKARYRDALGEPLVGPCPHCKDGAIEETEVSHQTFVPISGIDSPYGDPLGSFDDESGWRKLRDDMDNT